MVQRTISLPRLLALIVLWILLGLGFEGMMIILKADYEQLALELVALLVKQMFRVVIGG